MKFTLFSDSATALVDLPVDVLVIPLAQGNFKESEVVALLDARLDGLLSKIVEEERWKGKSLQMLQLHTHHRVSAKRLVLVTNQFGPAKVNAYAMGDRAEGWSISELTANAADVGAGVGQNPEMTRLQDPGELTEDEPPVETPGQDGGN